MELLRLNYRTNSIPIYTRAQDKKPDQGRINDDKGKHDA